MIQLESNANLIMTDSGGIQKEAFFLHVPCLTLRNETEWVELVEAGCNRIAGATSPSILRAVEEFEAFRAEAMATTAILTTTDLYGNGHSARQIMAILADHSAT